MRTWLREGVFSVEPHMGLLREYFWFLRRHPAWWLGSIAISLALLGAWGWLVGSEPRFIYSIF